MRRSTDSITWGVAVETFVSLATDMGLTQPLVSYRARATPAAAWPIDLSEASWANNTMASDAVRKHDCSAKHPLRKPRKCQGASLPQLPCECDRSVFVPYTINCCPLTPKHTGSHLGDVCLCLAPAPYRNGSNVPPTKGRRVERAAPAVFFFSVACRTVSPARCDQLHCSPTQNMACLDPWSRI